jgi:hypothetical protein
VTNEVDVTAPRRGRPDRDKADGSPPFGPPTRLAFRLFVASVLIAGIPVVVATLRALGRNWIPLGDNGFFAIRSVDVFGHHIPLLGTWSSSSLSYHTHLNNPGPLFFDALAVPVKVLGTNAGLAVGVALVNLAAIAGIAVFAYRRGGVLLGTLATAVVAALCWSMGSELLFEPWQPHSLLLPFLFFLVLIWSVACGDLVALPFAVFVGSMVLQTHLTYSASVPVLVAFAVLVVAFGLRRDRVRDPDRWPARRRHLVRTGAMTAVVGVAAWTQTLIEQFTSDGKGNLTRLVDAARSSHVHSVGYGLAARLAAAVVALPPWWFRPSVKDTFQLPGWHPPSLGLAVAALLVTVGVLAWCGWAARRNGDRTSALAVATATVLLVATFMTVARSPITLFGAYTPHELRSLWPVAAFLFFAILATVASRISASRLASARRAAEWLVGVFVLAVVVFGALNLPYANLGDGPNSQEWAIPAERQLQARMSSLEGHGPLLIDDLFFGTFADPYGGAVLVELQHRGVSFVARDPGLVRQLGPARQFTGRNATAALLLRIGDATSVPPPGSRRVASGEGVSAREQRELASLHRQLADYLRRSGVQLSSRGQDALRRGDLPTLGGLPSGLGPGVDPEPLFTSRELNIMIDRHDLVLDHSWSVRFARYSLLQGNWDRETVALFLGPLTAARGPNGQVGRG